MLKALKIYAIANTIAWGLTGVGCYFGHSFSLWDSTGDEHAATLAAVDTLAAAVYGWKRFLSDSKFILMSWRP